MIGYLTTNNAYDDALVVMDGSDCYAVYVINGEQAFRAAVSTDASLDDLPEAPLKFRHREASRPADFGTVIAINDGALVTVVNPELYDARVRFWLG